MANLSRKKFNYFSFFRACAEQACKAAQYLHASLSDFSPDTVNEQVKQMHVIENHADSLKHEMLLHLSHEFVPPIETEDIVELARELDDVVDAIDDVMQRIYIFRVQAMRPEALSFCALIVKCCGALAAAAEEFENFRKSKTITKHLIEINNIEEEADALFSESVRKLYESCDNDRDILVWTKIFDLLENCLDACEDAADSIESIIMKNS